MKPRVAVNALLALVLFTALASGAAAQADPAAVRASSQIPSTGTRWVVDPVHSQVDFRVRHLVGRVRGTFDDWYGVIVTRDGDWTHGTVNVGVQTASVNTGNIHRDADLRSARFFASDSFPRMTFESTGIVATDSTVEIGGILTLKGHARQVVLVGQYRGTAKDYVGQQRIAFDASTLIDRRDFGLTYKELVNGVPGIGNEVEITVAIEAIRVP
ncbi:MAG TPA: YceI family protein [Gemmatimonadales bacterium]|nr:YceI family protein [Gemmatimonadales bacterium]